MPDSNTEIVTAAREIRRVYKSLSVVQARWVAELEHEFPAWHIWFHPGYPDPRIVYARRLMTSPPAVVTARELAGVPAAIEEWVERRTHRPEAKLTALGRRGTRP
jgi:hypothetical protein